MYTNMYNFKQRRRSTLVSCCSSAARSRFCAALACQPDTTNHVRPQASQARTSPPRDDVGATGAHPFKASLTITTTTINPPLHRYSQPRGE